MIFSFLLPPTCILLACLVGEHACRPHTRSRALHRHVRHTETKPRDWESQESFSRLKRYASLRDINADRYTRTDPDPHPSGFDSDEDYGDGDDSDEEKADEFGNVDHLTAELEARIQRLDEITKSLEKTSSKMSSPGIVRADPNKPTKDADADKMAFVRQRNLPVLKDRQAKKLLNEVKIDVNNPLTGPEEHFKEITIEEVPPRMRPSYERSNMLQKFQDEMNTPRNGDDRQKMKPDANSPVREKLLKMLAQNLNPDSQYGQTDKAYGKKIILIRPQGNSLENQDIMKGAAASKTNQRQIDFMMNGQRLGKALLSSNLTEILIRIT